MEEIKEMAEKGSVKVIDEKTVEEKTNPTPQEQKLIAGSASQWFGKAGVTGIPGEDAWRLPFWQGLRPEFPVSVKEATLAESLMMHAGAAAFDHWNKRTSWSLPPSAAVLMARMLLARGDF